MATNRDAEAILDIVDAAQQIQRAVRALTLEAFQSDREKQAAVLYFYIIIGEATKRVSTELRSQFPDIPWRDMAGLRDIAAHQYDRVDLETIWIITQTSIPDLLIRLEPLLEPPEESQ
ncbi:MULTISPECIES: HepT-like ribonuclease domain-containing protein [unclassified Leptolyngbya]|uniref:HepT-like ribonuclease domain-containing protein n=1 Tax=unclassified Leptolyngbya TaxID=2650499 RepID=UPI001AC5BD6C|nr:MULTISPECIES: DUF86 domain-containing protein [unclassified Leptolyngbya]MBN8561198.1 DUF86 domain-containing protein [Leptolyngbya sp. UWPOB_LEPTO1]MCY6490606.1 DUF86 domain-containing protein [Leptolyngbya sp. GGD]